MARARIASGRPTLLRALALALAAAAAHAQVGAGATLEPTRLAIELDARDGELDRAAIEARLGVGVRSASLCGPRTFRLLDLDGPLPPMPERLERLRAVASLPGLAFATPVWRAAADVPAFPSRFALVRFLPGVPEEAQRAAIASIGGLRIQRQRFGGMRDAWRVETAALTGDELLAQVAALAALPIVKWAEPDRVAGMPVREVIPNDPLFPTAWGLHNTGQTITDPQGNPFTGTADVDLDAPAAWDVTQGDPGILVVVLDNGVDLTHPDLNLGPCADFTDSGTGGGPTAANACHGTQVAGCVSARIGNGVGAVGIAPNCRVASASIAFPDGSSVCNQGNAGMDSWPVDALDWAESIGARVSNTSMFLAQTSSLEDKLVETKANGMIHFTSAGNDFPAPMAFPETFHAVNAIGAVQWDATKASFSQIGNELDFSAPGKWIQTTDLQGMAGSSTLPSPAGDFRLVQGTSFACPYAAGVAALVLSRQPGLSPHEVWIDLVASAKELGAAGWDSSFGYGMLNANLALHVADEMAHGWVIVDPIAPTTPSLGTYHTFPEAIAAVPAGGLILPIPASYGGSLLLSKRAVLRSWGTTPTVIGQ